ncbi:hypothetical protein LZ32DRAFT_460313 [Colletotrichum eremochloae]|nr:hypothetical protein LZ32DRAFT_460313 [Colletotrichum eremochloae]
MEASGFCLYTWFCTVRSVTWIVFTCGVSEMVFSVGKKGIAHCECDAISKTKADGEHAKSPMPASHVNTTRSRSYHAR